MSERSLVSSGIHVKALSENDFHVKLGEHWIAVQYLPRVKMYVVRGAVFDTGYAPVVNPNDILWINTAIRGIADERKSNDYSIVYAQKS
jgi:hypothetical protein